MCCLHKILRPKLKKPTVPIGFAPTAKENKEVFLILRNPLSIFVGEMPLEHLQDIAA